MSSAPISERSHCDTKSASAQGDVDFEGDQRGGVCEEKVIERCEQSRIVGLLFKPCCVALTQFFCPQPLNSTLGSHLSLDRSTSRVYVPPEAAGRLLTESEHFPTFVSARSRP